MKILLSIAFVLCICLYSRYIEWRYVVMAGLIVGLMIVEQLAEIVAELRKRP